MLILLAFDKLHHRWLQEACWRLLLRLLDHPLAHHSVVQRAIQLLRLLQVLLGLGRSPQTSPLVRLHLLLLAHIRVRLVVRLLQLLHLCLGELVHVDRLVSWSLRLVVGLCKALARDLELHCPLIAGMVVQVALQVVLGLDGLRRQTLVGSI